LNREPDSPLDFDAAFDAAAPRLRQAVLAACPRDADWPARVAAAIYAVLDFALADPQAICILTRGALIQRPHGPNRFLELVEHFAELLRAQVPQDDELPASTERAVIGAVAVTIADHLRHDRLDRLRDAGPELVELSLRPYLGREQARRRARGPAAG
jgi:hypothetical protein